MANDHYVSEFLTKPWAVGRRRPRLHYYAFKSRSFGHCHAETLFAAEGLHTEQTGQSFNRLVENPVSRYRKELLRRDGDLPSIDEWKVYRALASFVWLQVSREMDARSPGQTKFSFDDLMTNGEALIEMIGHLVLARFDLRVVALSAASLPLYFTESVYFPIPMIGTAPILAVPLTPSHFVALPEKGFSERQLKEWLEKPGMMSPSSVGFGRTTDRVVLPPGALKVRDDAPEAFAKMLRTLRASCRRVFNAIGEANRMAGFRSFRAD